MFKCETKLAADAVLFSVRKSQRPFCSIDAKVAKDFGLRHDRKVYYHSASAPNRRLFVVLTSKEYTDEGRRNGEVKVLSSSKHRVTIELQAWKMNHFPGTLLTLERLQNGDVRFLLPTGVKRPGGVPLIPRAADQKLEPEDEDETAEELDSGFITDTVKAVRAVLKLCVRSEARQVVKAVARDYFDVVRDED